MGGLLGIVSGESSDFRPYLHNARERTASGERGRPNEWGLAVYEQEHGWLAVTRASDTLSDPAFETAHGARGSLLLAHARRRTTDAVSLDRAHPFRHEDWVFAHDGTIEHVDELRAALPDHGAPTLRGDCASEVLFAFLMTKLAVRGGAVRSRLITDMLLARTVEDLVALPSFKAATFVLSDGAALYAYRCGEPLFLLDRRSGGRSDAILVASEPLTPDEPWQPVPEGTLLAIWRRPALGWAVLLEPSAP